MNLTHPRGGQPSRRFLAGLVLIAFLVQSLPLPVAAAPAPKTATSSRKKALPEDQEKRIELLEKQLEKQNQLLQQMQKQLEEMRRQQAPVPVPSASPLPQAPLQAPPAAPSQGPAPAPDSPLIDDSVPPPPAGSPGIPGAPAPTGPPGIPAGPTEPPAIPSGSTAPAPTGTPGIPAGPAPAGTPGIPAGPAPASPGPAASPSPGGPLLDETVPPPTAPVPPTSPMPAPSPQGPSGAGGNALNPNFSAIGLFEVRSSSDKSNAFDNRPSVREVELAIQAPIDPFARYDLFLTIPSGGSLSVEEGYATFLALPFGFQGKMGMIKSPFGRNNTLHTHAFPQIDRPKVIEQFFGEEGLAGPGILLSNVLPLPWYSELSVQGMANDNDTLFSGGVSQKPIWVANWRNLVDLREDLTAELGLSGAYGSNCTPTNQDTRVAGASLTLKYKPLRKLGSWGLTWETEYLTETQRVPTMVQADPETPPVRQMARQSANGLYSYLEFQPNRNWFFNVRYDWTHLPTDPSRVMSGWTGLVGYRFSEFNSVRLQYSRYNRTWDNPLRQLFLQWNVVVGPHGAHKY